MVPVLEALRVPSRSNPGSLQADFSSDTNSHVVNILRQTDTGKRLEKPFTLEHGPRHLESLLDHEICTYDDPPRAGVFYCNATSFLGIGFHQGSQGTHIIADGGCALVSVVATSRGMTRAVGANMRALSTEDV